LIKAHRKKLYNCPVCREEYAVGNADATNLDKQLQNFMLLYFPKEIKEKRKENEKEQAIINKQKAHYRLPTSRRIPMQTQHTSSNCSIM
jgi:hypothetical protein